MKKNIHIGLIYIQIVVNTYISMYYFWFVESKGLKSTYR